MAAADWPVLAGGLGGAADPWAERDKLAAGSPVQITGLARAFAQAAGDASLASDLAKQGSQLTAEGYRVDSTPVHEVTDHVARTRTLLGNSGDNMDRIARILDGVADDLSTRTTNAKSDVAELERQLAAKQKAWQEYENRFVAAMAKTTDPLAAMRLEGQHTTELTKYRDSSVDLVKRFGKKIGDSVLDYDAALGKRIRDLADMGYYPPADLAEGPGDPESDPQAGSRDAQKVAAALKHKPGRQSLAEIDSASSELYALNAKAARGERLTDAERGYLNQFYDTLGADNLAKLSEHVRQAAPSAADMRRDVDHSPIATADDVYRRTMQPFGDSIMNLSKGTTDDGHQVRYESLPGAVRTLIDDTRLGTIDPHTGLRWPSDRFLHPPDNHGDPRNIVPNLLGGGVTRMDRYKGMADLMKSASVTGSTELGNHLTDSAIRAKQDLNAMQDNARWNLSRQMGGGTDEATRKLAALVDDSAPSDVLSVVGKNHEASSAALVDDHRRSALLGLNWKDSTGATDIVHAGTERDPAAGGGTDAQARAALAVVREVASDRDGYLGRMGDPMKDAVDKVGASYMDAFAGSPTDTSQVVHNRTDALGRSLGPTFELTRDDRDHFLQFVSGTGKDPAAAFQAQAKAFGQAGVADALAHGNPEQVHRALETAGRLDGAVTQANFDYTLDTVDGADKEKQAAFRATQIENRANQGVLNTIAVTSKEVAVAVIPGGGLIKAVGSPALSVLTEMVKGGISMHQMDDPAPTAQMPQTKEDLIRTDSATGPLHRNMMIAGAMQSAGAFGPGEAPAILSYDGNHDGVPDSPTSDSQRQDELGPAVRAGLNRWGAQHAQHGANGVVDPGAYDEARRTAASGAWDGRGSPSKSAWASGADPLYYGSNPAPNPAFGHRPDPRSDDDPNYDRTMNRQRPGG